MDIGDRDEGGNGRARVQKRDVEGNWTEITTSRSFKRSAYFMGLTVDGRGNLYGVDANGSRLEKRDVEGNWTGLTIAGSALGQVNAPSSLAVDSRGSLYVADIGNNRVQSLRRNGRRPALRRSRRRREGESLGTTPLSRCGKSSVPSLSLRIKPPPSM